MFRAAAHLLEDLGPDGHADLAEVRLLEQEHLRARLADAAADASGSSPLTIPRWYGSSSQSSWPVISSWRRSDAASTRIPIEVSSWRRRVTGFQTRMSPLSPWNEPTVRRSRLGRPVVVVGGAHLVRVAVVQAASRCR